MPTNQPFALPTTIAVARSGAVSLASLVNLYLEPNPQGAKSQFTLYGTPGLDLWTTVGSGPIRGIERMGSALYVVSGEELYHVSATGVATYVGAIAGSGNVHTTNNGIHVAIAVTGGNLYAANTTDGVLSLGLTGVNGATYQDGYGIFSDASYFWITALDDMTTIDPADFSAADADPDDNVGILSDHRELWIFGKRTTEVWYNSGAASFPFERAGAGFIEHGCRASGSIAKAENAVLWLGDDLAVYMAPGYQAQPISTPQVESLIAAVGDPGAAWAFTYRQLGHLHYVITWPDLTLVYDLTSGAWHQRKSTGLDRWRVSCHTTLDDRHIVGDCESGNLYFLDLDTYTDNGDIIRREAVLSPIHGNGQRVMMPEIYVDVEAGVGTASGDGSDPVLMLDWSDDGGATWSTELSRSIGKTGERSQRAVWNRLGSFRQRTLRLAIEDPVKVAMIGIYMRAQGMMT